MLILLSRKEGDLISKCMRFLVLAGCLYLCACEDREIIKDVGHTRFISYADGQMKMIKEGKTYRVIINEDFVIFEEE